MTPQYRSLQIADHRIHYFQAGRGPAVMLLHGGCCSAEDWFPLLPAFADRFRVVLPDGLVCPLTAWDLWLLADHLGVRRLCLIGHSAGGNFVREMYCLAPDRVWALVSIDSSAAVVPGSMILARRLPNSMFSSRAAAMYEANRAAMTQLKPHHRGDYPSAATIRCRRRAYRRQTQTPAERLADMARPEPVTERCAPPRPAPTPVADVGRFIGCPVLIYQTGRGKLGPEDVTAQWQQQNVQAAQCEYVVIKEAGHWPWLENPDLVLDTLVPFLETAGCRADSVDRETGL